MIIVRNREIYSKKTKKGCFILEKNKRFIRQLNESGNLIWEMAKKPVSIDKIVSKISSVYKKPVVGIKKDVERFVKKYLKEGFLIKVS